MKLKQLFLLLCSIASIINAKYHVITNERKYNDFINKYRYTVVCFVDPAKVFEDRSEKISYRKAISAFKKSLKSASLSGEYKDLLKQEVGFLLVDVSKKSAVDLDDEFNFTDLPACVLLENGQPMSEYGDQAEIAGFSTKNDILAFLDDYAEDELQEIVQEKEEQKRLEREERIARYNAYSRYYGWNPYGGWGPYYYGCGPYGCRPYYYGYPRAHIGFGVIL